MAFDVTAYGAVGDGVTDSTAAIQSAINAAVSAGGGMVLVPHGVYIVGTYGYLKAASSVRVVGDGPGSTTIRMASGSSKFAILDDSTGTASSIQIAASSLEGNDWALITGPGTLNIWADGSQLVNGVTTASTPTINSYTFVVAIEANLIAKTTNGLAFNVNAGLSCGEGPVVCNGTSWKHLYTGSTY